ncbi:BamA/TamA family outer membrane protein [Marinifilum sp. D737]|uniref:BamA/TamA family outer membrane protein n=1 Tax=Marinifilum sp. D737 TaxID=2969628 RepID=UPI002274762D|nr:BamA/TamA family outer membrane protein [Marinifilum sp. D737]MCY1633383.1 BamA/TamA family outer membrane protein [Marinifilum sp. D737]
MKKIIFIGVFLLMGWITVLSQHKVQLNVFVENNSVRIAKSLYRIQGKYSDVDVALSKLDYKIQKARQLGYLEANLDSLVSKNDKLLAFIHIGDKYFLNRISHQGVNQKDSMNFSFRLYNHKRIQLSEMAKYQQKIIETYNNKGYPFAKIYNDSVNIRNSKLDVTWNIEKGKFVVWDSIKLKGKLKVRNEFIMKYLDVTPNSPFSENTLSKVSARINNLSFCKELKPAEVEFVKNKAVLYTYLDRQASNRFDGILGLQSDQDDDESLAVTGEINLLLNNAFRIGEEIKLSWKKIDTKSQDLTLGFMHPYLIRNIGLDFDFTLSKQDTTYLSTNLNFGFKLFQKGNRHVKLYYEYHSSSLISTSQLSGIAVLPDYADVKTHMGGVGFNYSNLDYPFNPKRGWQFNSSIGIGKHKIEKNRKIPDRLYNGIDLNSSVLNIKWKGEINFPLSNKISYRVKNQSGFLKSDNLFVNDLFKIGGLNSLRGFDEASFRASRYSIVSNELRFIPEKNTSFYLFTDLAYYKSEILDSSTEDYPIGVGFGLSFATKAGVFSLNYASGKQENQSFDLRSAKIHFGFISRF